MAPQRSLVVFARLWHIERSSAFHDLVIEPLSPFAEIRVKAWDEAATLYKPDPHEVYIFCQVLPPAHLLQQTPEKLIWIPMWDEVRANSTSWWSHLPKPLRIVAFSRAVESRARQAGLTVLYLQYFKNPSQFEPAPWQDRRIVMYWNRRGIISPYFLERFCRTVKADTLLYRNDIDPYVDARAGFELPERLGNTIVEHFSRANSREEYLRITQRANILIAPRLFEGAGMVFLEALARGSAVFSHNGATMNEYITHKENGYFFERTWNLRRLRVAAQGRLAQRGMMPMPFMFALPDKQAWEQIAALDLENLGKAALISHQRGYLAWQRSIAAYANFVLK